MTTTVMQREQVIAKPDLAEIKRANAILFDGSQVVELRAVDTDRLGTISGYYNDLEKLAKDAHELARDPKVRNLYWVLNPCNEALLARCSNRYKSFTKTVTSDGDVTMRLWILIDCDPRRPKGVSSTDEEKALAKQVLDVIVEYLRTKGFSNPVECDSGNGYHGLYRIDLPNDPATRTLVETSLKILDAKFSTTRVAVDTTVFNAARICKVYGSVAQKGDNTPDRPHRLSRILSEFDPHWESAKTAFPITPREVIEQFVAEEKGCLPQSPSQQPTTQQPATPGSAALSVTPESLEKFFEWAGFTFKKSEYGGGWRYIIDHCEFNPDHNGTEVAVTLQDKLGYKCLHASCSENHWKQFREAVEARMGGKFSFVKASDSDDSGHFEEIVEAVEKHEDFKLLVTREALAKEAKSWLRRNAQFPNQISDAEEEWLVHKVILRRGLHAFCASYGSFKTLMALFLALALVGGAGTQYLGREVKTLFADGDTRPIRVYYLDNENPKGTAKKNCLCIGLNFDNDENSTFQILGEWLDLEPIKFFDDPRLIEAAKRERAFFIFDSLSQFIGAASENDNSEMTVELNKAKKLARISEGVLFLHHDDKGASGWRGCTAIIAVPDMCFNLTRGDANLVKFGELRFRPCESYEIAVQVEFASGYRYQVVDSTLGAENRASKVRSRRNNDAAMIEKARIAIENNAKAGNPPLSQNKLMQLTGIKGGVERDRILCASTAEEPRPWNLEVGSRSLVFTPLTEPASEGTQQVVEASVEAGL